MTAVNFVVKAFTFYRKSRYYMTLSGEGQGSVKMRSWAGKGEKLHDI